jgi:hypothetical protein
MWDKNVSVLNAKEVEDATKILNATQATSHRHCQPAVQDGLAGRSALIAE